MAVLAFIGMFAVGIAYFAIAALGFDHFIGPLGAGLVLLICFWFRLVSAISIGVFLGAYYVLGWHWLGAAVLAAPALLLIPFGVASMISDRFPGRR